MKMVAEMSKDLTEDVLALKTDVRFQKFLKWLEDSREMIHQHSYTVLDAPSVNYLQGAAKTIFDVVTETHKAFAYRPGIAIPSAGKETPYGDI